MHTRLLIASVADKFEFCQHLLHIYYTKSDSLRVQRSAHVSLTNLLVKVCSLTSEYTHLVFAFIFVLINAKNDQS